MVYMDGQSTPNLLLSRDASSESHLHVLARDQFSDDSVLAFDLHALINNVVKSLKPTLPNDLQIQTHLCPDTCQVKGEELILKQTLRQLVSRTAAGLSSGDALTIRTRKVFIKGTGDGFFMNDSGAHIQLDIESTGKGFRQTGQDHASGESQPWTTWVFPIQRSLAHQGSALFTFPGKEYGMHFELLFPI